MTRDRYRIYQIPKAAGGWRQIEEPDPALKQLQRSLLPELRKLPLHPAAHGFRQKRSVLTNAKAHLTNSYLLQMDIKDFFPSCKRWMVVDALEWAGVERKRALWIADVCALEGRLPQGAPTSPLLANLCASCLDARLAGLAAKFQAVYTRYADDMTFSSQSKETLFVIRRIAERIMAEEGFRVNSKKTRFTYPGHRYKVTGVVLSQDGSNRIRLPREQRRCLRAMLHQNPNSPQTKGMLAWQAAIERR